MKRLASAPADRPKVPLIEREYVRYVVPISEYDDRGVGQAERDIRVLLHTDGPATTSARSDGRWYAPGLRPPNWRPCLDPTRTGNLSKLSRTNGDSRSGGSRVCCARAVSGRRARVDRGQEAARVGGHSEALRGAHRNGRPDLCRCRRGAGVAGVARRERQPGRSLTRLNSATDPATSGGCDKGFLQRRGEIHRRLVHAIHDAHVR